MTARHEGAPDGSAPGTSATAVPRSAVNIAWTVLVIGGLLEVVWASMLNQAQGVTRPGWLLAGLAVSVVSVTLLGWAMRVIDLGTGYAAWIGIGSAGSVLAGLVVFGESTHPLRLLFLACIILGIVGLRFTEGAASSDDGSAPDPD